MHDETLKFYGSSWRQFRNTRSLRQTLKIYWLIWSLAQTAFTFSSVSPVRVLSRRLSSSNPVVFSLLTKLCILC